MTRTTEPGSDTRLRRTADIAGALAGMMLLATLWPMLAPAIRLSTGGSTIYRQARAGRDGRVFTMLKMRSMPPASEPAGPMMADKEDQRATRLGQWLRRTHLDELPQAWNVLRGEMTIIGPRPERPDFNRAFCKSVPGYSRRLRVRPGITGWAQIHQEHAATAAEHAEKARLDAEYLDDRTIRRDWLIIRQTIAKITRAALRTNRLQITAAAVQKRQA